MFFFKKKKPNTKAPTQPISDEPIQKTAQTLPTEVKAVMDQRYSNIAESKELSEPISQQALLQYFATYFAPNFDFYSQPGSKKYQAYFGCINAARDEMIQSVDLFTKATRWSAKQLVDLINNPVPAITNSMICGLIFRMGEYAVIKDSLYCVDFSAHIPNCIALYLLLTAHREPADKRVQKLDVGDNADKTPLSTAITRLQILDPDWKCQIVWPI